MSEQSSNRIVVAIMISGALIAGAILISQTGFIAFINEKADPLSELKKVVANELIDPKSAEFRNIRRDEKGEETYCGEVNAKNRMGAYIGFHLFYAKHVKENDWEILLATPERPNALVDICSSIVGHKSNNQLESANPIFYTLPEFLVTLKSKNGTSGSLEIIIILEMSKSDIPSLEKKLPEVLDAIKGYLDKLRMEDLASPTGVFNLRSGLLSSVNKVVEPIHITDILFKEITVK